MYVDGLKLFAKNEKEPETLIHVIRIYCQYIEMKFGILMKSGKRHLTDGIELLNQDKVRTLSKKEIYK